MSTNIVTVLCPMGVRPGQPISITHPQSGQRLEVVVPPGVVPGSQFQVQLPPSPAQPVPPPVVAIGTPVGGGAPPGYHAAAPPPSGYSGPDIRVSKEQWFQYHDRDASGGLDRQEIANALIVTFGITEPRRQAEIRGSVEACWGMFDYDYNGVVNRQEFLRPDGLADTIIANIHYP